MIFKKSFEVPIAGLIASFLGLAYCVFISIGWGVDAVCLTSGCRLVSGFKLGGLSPWWIAAFLFACLLALGAFRLRTLACALATLFLLGDCLFLLAMIFISPCAICLVAALLIFATWLALRQSPVMSITRQRVLNGSAGPVWLLLFTLNLIWILLFLLNLGAVLGELPDSRPLTQNAVLGELPGSRPLTRNNEASLTVYFSPSCPACREAVYLFENSANFYAVSENPEDVYVIADLEARLAAGQGLAAALDEIQVQRENGSYTAPELGRQQEFLLRFALLRNQARISRLGYDTLPIIMFEGLPKSWSPAALPVNTARPEVPVAPENSPAPAVSTSLEAPATPGLPENSTDQAQPEETADKSAITSATEANDTDKPLFELPFDLPFELPPDLRQGTAECGPAAEDGAQNCD
ncbi:MAG: hypothetical protein LBV80_05185 [Deltaproteobacteria bacterium]|jgi:hypothetical protein|nr:hypothetical protein [Deltaproteobacteria bacterium]